MAHSLTRGLLGRVSGLQVGLVQSCQSGVGWCADIRVIFVTNLESTSQCVCIFLESEADLMLLREASVVVRGIVIVDDVAKHVVPNSFLSPIDARYIFSVVSSQVSHQLVLKSIQCCLITLKACS